MLDKIIIDVREPDEFAAGHVPDAINIPVGSILDNADTLAQLPAET